MGKHEETILGQLNPQSAAGLINLANNVRGLLVLGLARLDGASQWDMAAQQERRSVLAVIGALEHGADTIKQRFAKELGTQGTSNPRERVQHSSAEEAAKVRASFLELDASPAPKPAQPPIGYRNVAQLVAAVGLLAGERDKPPRPEELPRKADPYRPWTENLQPSGGHAAGRTAPCPPGTHAIPGQKWTDRCTLCGWKRDTCMQRAVQIKNGGLQPSATRVRLVIVPPR